MRVTIQMLGKIWNGHEPDRYGWVRVIIGKRILCTNGVAFYWTYRSLLPLSQPRQ